MGFTAFAFQVNTWSNFRHFVAWQLVQDKLNINKTLIISRSLIEHVL